MASSTRTLRIETRGDGHIIDLTSEVAKEVQAGGISAGTATAFVPGSTAAITTIEFEPGLVRDTAEALARLIPAELPYAHNHGGDSNGHAHVRAAIVGPGVTVPVVDGRLTLGTWQQIVLIDFDDRPRRREVVLHVVGDQVTPVSFRRAMSSAP